jgi:soluble lytic murein transglycosylase
LAKIHETIGVYLDRETRARLAYITAKSGTLSADATAEAYQIAYSEDHEFLYYRMLASAELEDRPAVPVMGNRQSGMRDDGSSSGERVGALEAVCRGFLRYSQPEDLYPFAREFFPDIPVTLAMNLADSLSRAGFHTDALRLMVLAVGAEAEPVTDEQLAYLYPRPWLDEVSAAAERFGVPEYLLFALVRTESFFNPSIVSHAGAVGLTQLMRPTAGDIARKLKKSEFDLTDPATNLEFGAFYLAELIERLDGNVMAALFSYNAGITRVRSWLKTEGDLAPVLFLESLPFAETRGYGRKVLAASIVYGYLYYQKSPGEIIRELF